jgi:hypothetical protein
LPDDLRLALTGQKAELLALLPKRAPKTAPEDGGFDADYAEWVCRGIERDLGLPPGSLTLWEPIRSDYLSGALAAPRRERRKKSGRQGERLAG